MANYFDQFDTTTAPASKQNFFDQFDAPKRAPRSAEAVKAEYDALPWYGQAARAADDIVRSVANGMTFGFADKLAGAINGTGTETERSKSQEALDRAGSAGAVAEIGGAVATPVLAARNGLALAGRFGTDAMGSLTGLGARSGLMAVEGAGYGALGAAGHDQDIKTGAATGALLGGAGNVAAEGIANGVSAVAGRFNARPNIPSLDQLRRSAQTAYNAADNAGVVFTPQAVDRIRSRVVQSLTDMGYDPALQPGAAAVVRRLDDLRGGNVSLKGLDTLRKVARNGFIPGNNANSRALSQIVDAIDDAVANPAAGEILFGNAQAGADALTQARAIWGQVAKADTINAAREAAELRAASTGTGGNIDNATRQTMRQVYERGNGFTPDEDEALRTIIMGSPGQNGLRLVGKLAPTGVVSGGLGASIGAGAGSAIAGAAGATAGAFIVPAIGQAAKMTADRATQRNVDQLLNIIMAGGSRANAVPAPNAVQRIMRNSGSGIARSLLGAEAVQQ